MEWYHIKCNRTNFNTRNSKPRTIFNNTWIICLCLGILVEASGSYSHAEGSGTTAKGDYSHAEGYNTTSSGLASHAEGLTTTSTGNYSHAEGYSTVTGLTLPINKNAAEGLILNPGEYVVSDQEVDYTKLISNVSKTNRYNYSNLITTGSLNIITLTATNSSSNSVADTVLCTSASYITYGVQYYWRSATKISLSYYDADNILQPYTKFINNITQLNTGANAHSEGEYTKAIGSSSHAEGINTDATGNGSHSEGIGSVSIGAASHAEGDFTQALGITSHAEGSSTQAIGTGSHAEGSNTIASGSYSHAEGRSTLSSGDYSHAEGQSTIALGSFSHAEGLSTQAAGSFSHAEGLSTQAAGGYQHVQGQYNQTSSAQSAFIVGNGTAANARRNLIFASGSQFQISGSLLLKDILVLAPRTTTPTPAPGMIIVSGSGADEHIYCYLNSTWKQLDN